MLSSVAKTASGRDPIPQQEVHDMERRQWMRAGAVALVLGLAPLSIGALGAAQDPPQDEAAIDASVEAVTDEYDAAVAAFGEAYGAAQTDEERQKLLQHYPDASKWFPRLLAIGEEHPGTNGAVRALVWIVQHAQGTEEQAVLARDYLMNDYLLHPGIGPLCEVLGSRLDAPNEEALRKILAENPERVPQGCAAFALAKLLAQESELARIFAADSNAEVRKQYEGYYGKEVAARMATLDAAKLDKEAETLFEKVCKEYADVPGSRGKLGALAGAELFERRNLQIGKTAPDIAGEDIEGRAFKLSDYHGKVVMLDFWGNW
jgi:hypothetical protein